MLKNSFKIALRKLHRHPVYTGINITGLAIGMACCALIGMFVHTELSYESFLSEANRVYRLALDVSIQNQDIHTAYTARPLGPTLAAEFPEVEKAARLWFDPSGDTVLRFGDRAFAESSVFYSDPDFFEVFGIPLLSGDPSMALKDPFSMVLTSSIAHKYFGDTDPIGQTLYVREPSDNDIFTYTVTGVMADLPPTSHLAFDVLASYVTQRQSRSESWLGFGVYTYVKLRDEADPVALESKLVDLFDKYGGPQVVEEYGMSLAQFEQAGSSYRYAVQPIKDIHLHSSREDEIKPTGNIMLVYLFGVIALVVLVLATINFVNLATAQAVTRSTEIGVRKTLGSNRHQLVIHFLVEAFVLSGIALVLALALIKIGVPIFNDLMGYEQYLAVENIWQLGFTLLAMAGLVGLVAGAYPAFFLSSFKPALVLKGGGRIGQRNRLRDLLVIFQFSIATALIACTAIIYMQMRYMTDKHLGFEAEQVIVMEGAEVMRRQGEAFRTTLRTIPGVLEVTNSEQVPGRFFNGSSFKMEGATDDTAILMDYTYASFDFVETLGLEIVEGRSLSREFPSDSLAVILNEAAVHQLGLIAPIGQRLHWTNESVYTIVGVVKDFHVYSLHRTIGPIALLGPDPRNTNRPNLLVAARINTENVAHTLASVEAAWKEFAPQAPFVYSFIDDNFAALYETEQRTSILITIFTGLAVLIACIGLFGLSAYMVQRRKKEISVRKVLGASLVNIVGLLSKDFVRLVGISAVVAIPLAYLVMQRWVQDFSYAVEPGMWLFLGSGVIVLLIALGTVSIQSIRAAIVNPAITLHHD